MTNGQNRFPEAQKASLDYAWKWFSLHAAHRMQAVNFFLVATAFLFAAFTTASKEDKHVLAIGVAILKFHKAEGIAGVKVKEHEQLKRAAEIGLGHLGANMIILKSSNLTSDGKFDDLVAFVKRQL